MGRLVINILSYLIYRYDFSFDRFDRYLLFLVCLQMIRVTLLIRPIKPNLTIPYESNLELLKPYFN